MRIATIVGSTAFEDIERGEFVDEELMMTSKDLEIRGGVYDEFVGSDLVDDALAQGRRVGRGIRVAHGGRNGGKGVTELGDATHAVDRFSRLRQACACAPCFGGCSLLLC